MNVIRSFEKLAATTARAAWPLVKLYNATFERPSAHPKWAPAPLLKTRERTFPQLGWPRTTDSLCPTCVKEARTAILDGTPVVVDAAVGRRALAAALLVIEAMADSRDRMTASGLIQHR